MGVTNTMGGERPRNLNDAYPTPDALAHACCAAVAARFGTFTHIVEPSAGSGPFVRAAAARWPGARIGAVDLSPDRETLFDSGAHDVWEARWEDHAPTFTSHASARTLIIGNPPFVHAEEHARLALDVLAKCGGGGVLAFVLRASFLAGGKRVAGLWSERPCANVWNIAPRPSFTGDGKTDGAEYALVAWDTAHTRGGYVGDWLAWVRP